MTAATELMAAGIPVAAATQLGGASSTGLKAAGSTKAAALVLVGSVNVFATVSSGTGALLPSATGSPPIAIGNGGSNALSVYANGTDTINSNSAGAAFSVTNGKTAVFVPSGTKWIGILSA